jgi:xanthine/CO dehydrogenase XdhC/CoxF family maturation factor
VTTPIGLPELTGKDPATIAVGVAAALLLTFERELAVSRGHRTGSIEHAGAIAEAPSEPIDERR